MRRPISHFNDDTPDYFLSDPAPQKEQTSYGKKCGVLLLQCLLLMIATLVVYSLVYTRQDNQRAVISEITKKWGGPVYFGGLDAGSEMIAHMAVPPSAFNCEVTVNSRTLHRGIYEVQVYDAKVSSTAKFAKRSITTNPQDTLRFYLNIPPKRVDQLNPPLVNGHQYQWDVVENHIVVEVPAERLPDNIDVQTSFTIRGSESFYVEHIGYVNNITIHGDASDPSFRGSSLPNHRAINDNQFSATWHVRTARLHPSFNYANHTWVYSNCSVPKEETFNVGVDFLLGLDSYQMVKRTLKYSFILILLTYIAVFAIDIMSKRPIPLLNYFLIGAALVIFYTLLLAFSEIIAFGWAYIIAATMTVSLISFYIGKILQSPTARNIICIVLFLYYLLCYIMLSANTYALLIGSLILFAAIAFLMYATVDDSSEQPIKHDPPVRR